MRIHQAGLLRANSVRLPFCDPRGLCPIFGERKHVTVRDALVSDTFVFVGCDSSHLKRLHYLVHNQRFGFDMWMTILSLSSISISRKLKRESTTLSAASSSLL